MSHCPSNPIIEFLAYADGKHDLLSIAEATGIYAGDLIPIAKKMHDSDLIEVGTICPSTW